MRDRLSGLLSYLKILYHGDVPGKNFVADPILIVFLAMKLDTSHLRYLSDNDFRVLTAVLPRNLLKLVLQQVEMGSKNHLVVPTPLITQIAKLRSGSASNSISNLAKAGLISRLRNAKCSIPFHSPLF